MTPTQNNINPPLDLTQISNIEKVRGFLHVFYSYVMSLAEYNHRNDDAEIKDNVTFWITEQFGELDGKLEDVEYFFYGLMRTKEIDPFDDIIRANYENEKKRAKEIAQ